jgi:hypothetical protein
VIEYNRPISRFLQSLAVLIILQTTPSIAHAQTATIIPANEAAAHVGEYATVEGVVAKVFTSKSGSAGSVAAGVNSRYRFHCLPHLPPAFFSVSGAD